MTLQELISAFVDGDVTNGRSSALSVRGATLYSYSYPLAYRGRDVNGSTTVFVNTALTGETVGSKPNPFSGSEYRGLSARQEMMRDKDTAFSVTTSRHRRMVSYTAEDANLNVIVAPFGDNGLPDAEYLPVGSYSGYRAPVLGY